MKSLSDICQKMFLMNAMNVIRNLLDTRMDMGFSEFDAEKEMKLWVE
jgi:hypothetical protein